MKTSWQWLNRLLALCADAISEHTGDSVDEIIGRTHECTLDLRSWPLVVTMAGWMIFLSRWWWLDHQGDIQYGAVRAYHAMKEVC